MTRKPKFISGYYSWLIEIAAFVLYLVVIVHTSRVQLFGTGADEKLHITIYFAGIVAWFLVMTIIEVLSRKGVDIAKIYLTLYLVIGAMYMVAVPLHGVPDEAAHLYRVYGITEGDLIAPVSDDGGGGSLLPDNIGAGNYGTETTLYGMREVFFTEADTHEIFFTYTNTAHFSPLNYLPQSIGMLISKLFTDMLFVQAYAGRLFSFACVGVIMFLAIKRATFGREIIAVIGLFPQFLQEAISLSGDAFCIAVCIAFVANIVYLLNPGMGIMKAGDYARIYLLLVFLASCKMIYVVLALLLFLIPPKVFGARHVYIINIILAGALLIFLVFGWLFICGRYFGYEYRIGVDVAAQGRYITDSPFAFLSALFMTYVTNFSYLWTGMISAHLGIYTVEPPIALAWIGTAALVLAAISRFEGTDTTEKLKESFGSYISFVKGLVFVLMFLFSLFMIGLAEYLEWTPVGADVIEGIQGRYFLPMILLPFLTVRVLAGGSAMMLKLKRSLVLRIITFVSLASWVTELSYYII